MNPKHAVVTNRTQQSPNSILRRERAFTRATGEHAVEALYIIFKIMLRKIETVSGTLLNLAIQELSEKLRGSF